MKNKAQVTTTSWTRTERLSPSFNPNLSNGGTTISSLVLSSSTNLAQNPGNRITGTPYSYSKQTVQPLEGSYSLRHTNGSTVTSSGSYIGAPSQVNQHTASITNASVVAKNKAITDMYDKLRGEVDLSIDAFQIRQTLNMIRKPMNSLTNLANQIRRRAKVTGRPFSEAWLEYTYGWKPLVSTAYGVANIMGESACGPKGQIFKGSGRSQHDFNGTTSAVLAGYNLQGRYDLKSIDIYKCYTLVVLSEASKVQKTARYTSLNPASISWELLPYSFVVDWFYDVGSYLRATESALLYKSLIKSSWGSALSIRETVTRLDKPAPGLYSGYASVKGVSRIVAFERSGISGTPSPTKPTTGQLTDLSWRRWTSAFALLRQAFKP